MGSWNDVFRTRCSATPTFHRKIDSWLKSIRPGNMVHFEGLLVEAMMKEGWLS